MLKNIPMYSKHKYMTQIHHCHGHFQSVWCHTRALGLSSYECISKELIHFHSLKDFLNSIWILDHTKFKLKHPLLLSTEISGVSSGCQQGGCLTCSDYNGCLSCKPRFFMHLERIGMKQIGVCMTSCPPGFYGTRSPERNTCTSKPWQHRSNNK